MFLLFRHTEVDGATAAAGGHAHHQVSILDSSWTHNSVNLIFKCFLFIICGMQGLVVSEEGIQKLVAMGFERVKFLPESCIALDGFL